MGGKDPVFCRRTVRLSPRPGYRRVEMRIKSYRPPDSLTHKPFWPKDRRIFFLQPSYFYHARILETQACHTEQLHEDPGGCIEQLLWKHNNKLEPNENHLLLLRHILQQMHLHNRTCKHQKQGQRTSAVYHSHHQIQLWQMTAQIFTDWRMSPVYFRCKNYQSQYIETNSLSFSF